MTALAVAVAVPTERLTGRAGAGVMIGFVGVVLVSGDLRGEASFIGLGAMLAGSLSYALAMVYARRFINPLGMGAVKLAAYQTALAAVALSLLTPKAGVGDILLQSDALIGLVVGLGLVGTGVAFVIYYYLIARLGALTAASVYYVPPGVALALGYFFRG